MEVETGATDVALLETGTGMTVVLLEGTTTVSELRDVAVLYGAGLVGAELEFELAMVTEV